MTLYYMLFSVIGIIVFAILGYTVFFRVYKITVDGDPGQYTQEEIVEQSGIEIKSSLFGIDQREVTARVSTALPYIESVQVKKRFPTTIELIVAVSKPVGAVEAGAGYLYINEQGKILESGLSAYDPSIPLITGITPASTNTGEYPFSQMTEQMQILRELSDAIEATGIQGITMISLADRLNLRILVEDRILAELGTQNSLAWKLTFVKNSMRDNMDSSTMGVFDVSMCEEDGKGYYYDARNLRELMMEKSEQAQGDGAMAGADIQVDPETGVIVVGPHKPADEPEPSSSSESSAADEASTTIP